MENSLSFFRKWFLLIFFFFLQKKEMDFFDYQPFVCPCAVHCDSEHKQINKKELGELLHCFWKKKKKNCGFCEYDNCIHCKKLKYITQYIDNAYYFSPWKDAPWQPTHWKVFLYRQIDKEFGNIQKHQFNFSIEIKYVWKSWTIDWQNNFWLC